jgi:hypothetical protein
VRHFIALAPRWWSARLLNCGVRRPHVRVLPLNCGYAAAAGVS